MITFKTSPEKDYSDTADFFDKTIELTIDQIIETLLVKGKEYRRNGNPYQTSEKTLFNK